MADEPLAEVEGIDKPVAQLCEFKHTIRTEWKLPQTGVIKEEESK